jgi:hypothetical protein
MREWGAKNPGLLAVLAGVAGGVLSLAIDLLFARGLDQTIFDAVFYALFVGVSCYFTLKKRRKTTATLAEHGQAVIFLRYPNSLPGSLSGIWDMGVCHPSSGSDRVPTGCLRHPDTNGPQQVPYRTPRPVTAATARAHRLKTGNTSEVPGHGAPDGQGSHRDSRKP